MTFRCQTLQEAEPRHLRNVAPSKKHFLETNVICLWTREIHINHVGSPAHAHRRRHTCHWSHWCRHGFQSISPRGHNSILGYLCPWRCLAHSSHLLCIAEYQEFTFCVACMSLPFLVSPSKPSLVTDLALCHSSACSKTSSGTSTSNPCPSSPLTSSSPSSRPRTTPSPNATTTSTSRTRPISPTWTSVAQLLSVSCSRNRLLA